MKRARDEIAGIEGEREDEREALRRIGDRAATYSSAGTRTPFVKGQITAANVMLEMPVPA